MKRTGSPRLPRRKGTLGRPALGDSPRITNQVMRVGMKMFLDKGFANTTIDGIAARASISKATFYSRFKSKEALLEACIADFAVRRAPRRLDAESMALPFEERINRLSDHILDMMLAPETIKLERLATAESYRFPQIAHIANSMGTERGQEVIRWFLEDAVERRDLVPVDVPLLAQMVMDLHFGFLRRAMQGTTKTSDREAIWGQMHATNGLLFRGLRTNSGL